MKKGISSIIVLVVVLLVVAAGGYFYYASNNQTVETNKEVTADNVSPSPSNVSEDWETYTSDKYGFTFRYPSEANLNDNDTNYMSVSFMGQKQKDSGRTQTELFDGYSFNVVDLSDEGEFEDLNDFAQSRIAQLEDVCSFVDEPSIDTLNGNKYISVYAECLGDFTNYYFEYNGKYFEVSLLATGDEEDTPKYEKIVEDILSTFNFTN